MSNHTEILNLIFTGTKAPKAILKHLGKQKMLKNNNSNAALDSFSFNDIFLVCILKLLNSKKRINYNNM